MAVREKDRIVAEPGLPARREDEDPVHPALESLLYAIRPGERQHADESGAPRRRSRARPEFALDASHGGAEVFRRPGPSRRINARRPVERIDAKPGIIGERDQSRSVSGGARLQQGVIAESRPGLLRLLKTERRRSARRDVEGPSRSSNSLSLPALCVAMTRRPVRRLRSLALPNTPFNGRRLYSAGRERERSSRSRPLRIRN